MLETITVNNALFFPARWSNVGLNDFLCDENGDIVKESCLIRGPSLKMPGGENVTNPDLTRINGGIPSTPLLKGEYLFLGSPGGVHFGHAITEGLARFWAIGTNGSDSVRVPIGMNPFGPRRMWQVLFGRDGARYIHAAIRSNGLSRRNFLFTREPVRLAKIVVPQSSTVLRQRFYPEHLETTRKVSQYFLPKLSDYNSSVPVYLSKTKLKKFVGKVKNESSIERFMVKELGARVVYPERLTPREAVEIFNQHSVFVGPIGSAFHNLLFRRRRERVTAIYLTASEPSYRNYLEIDDIVGVSGHYAACLSPTRIPREYECDIEVAKAAIISVLNEPSKVVSNV